MTPLELMQYVDVLRVLFGVAILITYLNPRNAATAGKWFWFGVLLVVAIGGMGLRPWIEHPSLDSWRSFGSLFQAIFNFGVAGVLLLRHHLYGRRGQSEVSRPDL